MKKILTSILTICFLFSLHIKAQTLQQHAVNKPVPSKVRTKVVANTSFGKTTTCGVDTVEYPLLKATSSRGISINAATSAAAAYQWYPSMQSITVSGFTFFAFLVNTAGILSQNVTVSIFNAGADSMPTGAALRSVTMSIDSVTGSGSLAALSKRVIFGTPVTIGSGNGYVLALENTSANPVILLTNDWDVSDGNFEWCSSVKLGTTNTRSYGIAIGSVPFNSDFLMSPIVTYSITADYTSAPACFTIGSPLTLTNTSSAINFSRFYNLRRFNNAVATSFSWNFGNSTGGKAVDTSVIYSAVGPYNVTLTDTLEAHYRYCVDTKVSSIGGRPATPTVGGAGNYCVGANISLTCNTLAGATYNWTGPNGFTSNLQNPTLSGATVLMSGTYSVTVTLGICTSLPSSLVVNVIQQPTVSNTSPVCFGQSVSFTAITLAGANYAWTGPNSFVSSSQNPNRVGITTADTGVYSLSITLAGCSFSPVTTRVVGKEIPVPPTVTSPVNACIGSTVNLSASGSYLSPTYSWTGPNAYSSSTQNPSFTANNINLSGTYNVSVTVNGCSSNSSSILLNVNTIPTAPTLSNNGALCVGQTLSLTASLTPSATYTWSGPNGFTSTVQNPVKPSVTMADVGIYSAYITLNGCNSSVSNTTVSITASAPTPIASSNTPVCTGQTLNLMASSVSGATYAWSGPNGFTSTVQNPVISNAIAANAGTYSVTATTSTCGTSPASNTQVTIVSLSVSPVISNSGPSCEGTSCNLNITTVSGASYNWTGPNSFVSTTQNPVLNNITKAMAGVYSVSISTTQCGVISSYTTEVIVKQKPIINSVVNNSPICAGDTLQVGVSSSNTSSLATYSWTGVNGFTSSNKQFFINNASSLNDGQYTVSATDSGCISAPFNLNVSIKARPNAPTINVNSPICEGSRLDLSASIIGGATYNWSGPNGFTSTLRSPSINNMSKLREGFYKVYCTLNGCKSLEENAEVIVNSKPITPVISNVPSICEGANVSFTTPFVASATYAWSGPNGFTSSNQNININAVTANQAGTYSCIVTVANCASNAGSSDILVNSIPSTPLLSSFPINKLCAGDSLQLFATFIDLATYSWTGPAGFVSTQRNPTIKNTNQSYTGTYTAIVTKNACSSLPANISITVNPSPNTGNISGLTTVSRLDTTSYAVNGLQGSSFDWNVTNANVVLGAGSNKIQVKWLVGGAGLVKVTETSNQGCVGIEKSYTVNVLPAIGLDELKSNNSNISIYPNPVNNLLYVVSENAAITNVVIFDLIGNEVLKTNNTTIDLSEVMNGIYFVRVTDKEGSIVTRKILKK